MAKKKGVSAEPNTGTENSGSEEKAGSQKGLSKEAWVAIGTIVAALITGTVTLLMHVLPQASRPTANPPLSSTTPASPSSRAAATPGEAILGKWVGTAKDSNGTSFQITLDIKKPCSLNEQCGSISVSHVPCYGEVFLVEAQDNEFEFRVANFDGQSNRAVCQPGAGEHFRLRADGKLAYTTTYEPVAEGTLERTRN